jgi:hypothetical protein
MNNLIQKTYFFEVTKILFFFISTKFTCNGIGFLEQNSRRKPYFAGGTDRILRNIRFISYNRRSLIMYSAICTALSAAPLRI